MTQGDLGAPAQMDSTSKSSDDLRLELPKVHHVTVCMVPPPDAEDVWKSVSNMRRQLQDPGYYRWPPHANLLYPFLEIQQSEANTSDLSGLLDQLRSATQQVEPFPVKLQRLGTFGGKSRGVLWLSPDSSGPDESTADDESDTASPPPLLLQLHQRLEQAFPMCRDQTKGGSFTPHVTLSHFKTLDDALAAQQEIERDFAYDLTRLQFLLDRIYLLRRQGDGGQFLRVADIGLGKDGAVEHWDAPIPFPSMPTKEDDWVHEERMKLKARRNYSSGRKRRGGASKRSPTSRRSEPRVPDTPEVIAAKRAERKAKREALEREQQQQSSIDIDDSPKG